MKDLEKENKRLKKALKLATELINTTGTFKKASPESKDKVTKAFKKVGYEVTI